jgi:hypothetical protein
VTKQVEVHNFYYYGINDEQARIYSICECLLINNQMDRQAVVVFDFLITYPIHVLKSSENIYSIVLSNEILSLSHTINNNMQSKMTIC